MRPVEKFKSGLSGKVSPAGSSLSARSIALFYDVSALLVALHEK
jgi:hypothetical protein